MDKLFSIFKIPVEESIYNKEPESPNLGKPINKSSIELKEEMKFDRLTFIKSGLKTDSSIDFIL